MRKPEQNAAVRKLLRGARKLNRNSDGIVIRDLNISILERARYGMSTPYVARCRSPASRGSAYLVKLAIEDKAVKVHCDCDDFAYTFYPTLRAKGLALKEVERPKPNGTGVRRSVDEVGCCKHVKALIERALA